MVAALMLLSTIQPELDESSFAWSMAVLGVGMGLLASQLGNVVQSSVDASGRGEAGGLQFTGQQLGSSLGVALLGAIVLSGLTAAFVSNISADERISSTVSEQVGVAVGSGIDFVSADQIGAAAQEAGLDEPTSQALVDDYESAQLQALKTGTSRSGLPGPALARVHQGSAPPGALEGRAGSGGQRRLTDHHRTGPPKRQPRLQRRWALAAQRKSRQIVRRVGRHPSRASDSNARMRPRRIRRKDASCQR